MFLKLVYGTLVLALVSATTAAGVGKFATYKAQHNLFLRFLRWKASELANDS